MIDTKNLDNDLLKLIDKKSELNNLDYNHLEYDLLEEEVHKLEDQFLVRYGNYLEEAFHEVHDEYCPDNDVLLPIAYVPNKVVKTGVNTYVAAKGQGVYIEADDFDSSETKLALLPGPTRIELLIDSDRREVVWTPT
ncbi:MAG: hypothetical protein AAGF85_10640 [Bacteroidota bacterium]